jgi:TM2 domain-containing membrane protein YozV
MATRPNLPKRAAIFAISVDVLGIGVPSAFAATSGDTSAPADIAVEFAPFAILIAIVGLIVYGIRYSPRAATVIAAPDNPTGEKYCFECGKVIRAKAEICPFCGVRQPSLPASDSRSKVTAALFAIFLGGLGVHKFYLGKPVQGILYILFCWTFIPMVIGFVEGLVYLSMQDAAFAKKYG